MCRIFRQDNSRVTIRRVTEDSAEQRLARLRETVIACRKCQRLVQYREEVARTKRRAFRDWTYWGRPVPGFGDRMPGC